jgi:hypothetical protein
VRGIAIVLSVCWCVATPLGARGQDASLAPYHTANAGTLLADGRLHEALDRLASLPEGAVLDALAAAGVRIEVGAVPADDWAASFLAEGRIVVNPDVLGADPRAIAALIAHEATHMHHWADGTYPGLVAEFGREEGCAREETEGALVEQRVWSALIGDDDVPADHPYVQQLLQEQALARDAPDAFRELIEAHVAHCWQE